MAGGAFAQYLSQDEIHIPFIDATSHYSKKYEIKRQFSPHQESYRNREKKYHNLILKYNKLNNSNGTDESRI